MRFPTLIDGTFIRRINRFVCEVKLGKDKVKALLRNTGRLSELLKEGSKVYLARKSSGKLPFELLLVETPDSLVCVNSHIPPLLVEEFLREKGFTGRLKKEVKVGKSRIDLLINDEKLVETKSVNLVKNGVALFPDAPTLRGTKHIEDLLAVKDRYSVGVYFVIQRSDAKAFSPNWETDRRFSQTLMRGSREGLEVKAFLCEVDLRGIKIVEEVDVKYS